MKIAALLVGLPLTLLLTGCVSSTGPKPLTAADNGAVVKRQVGDTLTLTLPTNRTTGYSWFESGNVTGVLSLEAGPAYSADRNAGDRVGAGGATTWTWRAISPGKALIRMDYRRPFEEDITPARRFDLTVEVSK